MNRLLLSILVSVASFSSAIAQDMVGKATAFIKLLNNTERSKALYPFDTTERFRFHFVPQDDRKGISLNELTEQQRAALTELMKTCLSETAVKKVNGIIQLENVLTELEHRTPEDHYRDPGKYFVTIFGIPSATTIWGWRFEGHHIAYSFSADKKLLVSGTPSFMGSNPCIVLSGPQKNKEVLKEETEKGFALLHALSPAELAKAVIDAEAPAEIITGASRTAMIDHPAGIRYNELSNANQQLFLQLINIYIHRYTTLFAESMLKDIQAAGLDKLWFTWAGSKQRVMGKGYYYRIQGPTIIIEYDNTQNNANHVHTVIRDLKNDFGGDQLLEHYRKGH